MSLVSTRVNLLHRCKIRRNSSLSLDEWGQPDIPTFEDLDSDVPCRAWMQGGREAVATERTVVIKDLRLVLSLESDVTESDQIAEITERGAVIYAGPFGIEAVLRHKDHLELLLVEVSGG